MKIMRVILVFAFLPIIANINGCTTNQEKEINLEEMAMEVLPSEESVSTPPNTIQFSTPEISNDRLVPLATSWAASPINDKEKKFIRKATLNIKVKEIVKATHQIENIIINRGGFIVKSIITNEELYKKEIPISEDSVLVRTKAKLSGQLILRVHYSQLDSCLREVALAAEQITYRTVEAKEKTFDIMANRLEQAKKKDKIKRVKNISGGAKSHKLDDLLDAENMIDAAREQEDVAIINEHRLYDDIEYSTIAILLEQDALLTTSVKEKEKEINPYEPGFLQKLGSAFVLGWNFLLDVIVFLVEIWSIVLVVGIVIVGVVYLRRNKRNKKAKE